MQQSVAQGDKIHHDEPSKPALKKLTSDIAGPSLKSMLAGETLPGGNVSVQDQFELYNKKELSESFTEAQFHEKWATFTATLDNRPNLKSALANFPTLVQDNMLMLKVDSPVQEEQVKGIKPQIVSWLRRELNNSAIDLTVEIVEVEEVKLVYTDDEKYEDMLKKNPKIALLKQRFMLDFDD
ncbi:MAG: hypothetical protein FWG22_02140 [Prolixibacteraceae bacterium]|nr:hypothetical protein [Prolixibacteraceae bacterium]